MQNITTANFEAELIEASNVQPVLLDIWAEWCGPCKALGPVLEKLETDYAGRFKLGKLDADAEPEITGQLSQMFGVRSIPFCVLFKDGQPVDGFVGALPERDVQAFLDKHVPSADETVATDAAAEAEALLADGNPDAAIEKLAAAVAAAPANDTARADYLRALLDANRTADARAAYDPVAHNVILDPRLAAAGLRLQALESVPTLRSVDTLQAILAADKRDFQARYDLAVRLFAEQAYTAAMDELLEILMRQKTWNDEAARKLYVSLLDSMLTSGSPSKVTEMPEKGALEFTGKAVMKSADPIVDSYRRKLSMILF